MFLVCGEALFDLFLVEEHGPGSSRYDARAGGSPFNVAIGLSRLGVSSGLLTGLSNDLLGVRLRAVLKNEDVSAQYAVPTDRPTTISLVGVDAEGVPAYQFYGKNSADVGLASTDIPEIEADVEGLHFGSYSIAAAPVADAFVALAQEQTDRFISLDPNVRPTVEPDLDIWRARLNALIPHVNLLKVSREDLDILYGEKSSEEFATEVLSAGASLVVVTDGGGMVKGWTSDGATAAAEPPSISVVDTVGAGDTFQAALIKRIRERDFAVDGMDKEDLADILDYCARAAAITSSRRGANLPRADELNP